MSSRNSCQNFPVILALPMSPSRYPAPAVPEVASADSATQVSPTPVWMVHSLQTMDVFPTYEMSPDVSYYKPATSPVTPALPVDSDYVRRQWITSSLMDGDSDLPLPLLPLPDDCILDRHQPTLIPSLIRCRPTCVGRAHLRYFREHRMWGKSPWC